MSVTLWVMLAVCLAVFFWAVGAYNRLVRLKNAIANAFGQIDVQLKRRYDLIPNLVEVARKYLAHESETLEAVIEGVPFQRHATLPAAVAWCFEQTRPGDAVLLSPACASLDMFRNYGHRAEVFVQAVQALAHERGQV